MGHLIDNLQECGLPSALEVMGDRWSFMILRAAFNGVCHYEQFLETMGIARNILANRLARLVAAGIMQREPCADDRRKVEYRLTEKGVDLLPAMLALRQWGEKYGLGAESGLVLADKRDNLAIDPIGIHAADGRKIGWHELQWRHRNELGKMGDECCG